MVAGAVWAALTAEVIMGLLDIGNFLNDPSNASNLGMIQGLLQGGATSRLPITTGQAVAMGIQGANTGRMNSIQMQQQQTQLEKDQYANQMMRMRMPYIQQRMGQLGFGGNPGQPDQYGQPMTQPDGSQSGQPYSGMPQGGISANPGQPQSQPAPQGLLSPQSQPSVGIAADPNSLGSPAADRMLLQGQLDAMMGLPQGNAEIQGAFAMSPFKDPAAMQLMANGVMPGTAAYKQGMNAAQTKSTYIAPVNSRPGTITRDPITGQPLSVNPKIPEGATPLFDASGNVVAFRGIDGAVQAMQAASQAVAAGKNAVEPVAGYDSQGNPTFVSKLTASGGGVAAGGMAPANGGSAQPGPQGAFVGDPNSIRSQINRISDPTERSAALQALNNQMGGAASSQVRPGLSPGVAKSAESALTAPSNQMATQQQALSSQDSVYQQSRESLLNMLNIANNPTLTDSAARFLPDSLATRINNDAAKYEKYHSNYIALQGKSLGAAGTDASRQMVEDSVPDFTKPQDAKLTGLNSQLNQLDLSHLKRQVLTPQQGVGATPDSA